MFFIPKNNQYITGTTPRVDSVENNSPPMIESAIGSHISPPPRYNGSKPRTIVAVVNNIGLNRFDRAL